MKKIVLIALSIFMNFSFLSCSESDDFELANYEIEKVQEATQTCCYGNGGIKPPVLPIPTVD